MRILSQTLPRSANAGAWFQNLRSLPGAIESADYTLESNSKSEPDYLYCYTKKVSLDSRNASVLPLSILGLAFLSITDFTRL